MPRSDFRLSRDAFGRLVVTGADGTVCAGVVPVRAYPISAAEEGVALVNTDGREVAWFDRVADVPDDMRQLIEAELASREFMPEIRRIASVSSFATPSTWQIETDRGATQLVLKGEEDIRRLGRSALLIADSNGIQFLVRDIQGLDRGSRKLLDRFL
ncbi:MAG TPA: DUF1854 domain-containing protein [Rhodocyclaceae bacterium]|nr:DUF1854 domain-containing protein [Rhodocyclaceae bacterium]